MKDDGVKVKYNTGLPCFAVVMGVLILLLPLPTTDKPKTFCLSDAPLNSGVPVAESASPAHYTHLLHRPKDCVHHVQRQNRCTVDAPQPFGALAREPLIARPHEFVDCFEMNIESNLEIFPLQAQAHQLFLSHCLETWCWWILDLTSGTVSDQCVQK